MSSSLPHEADANQAKASDPEASAWVSANAGTGKTAVLVKRILRLLLAGSKPEAILCLTYTKTAAAEMQNRLLQVLSDWATITTEQLRDALADLTGRVPEQAVIERARRLFAVALEAKGGLKIHTIHGFCERLLQRFPLEADIIPHFSVLDERGAAELRRAAFDATLGRAAEDREGALGLALAKIIAVTSEDYFRKVIDAVLAKRAALDLMVAYHRGRPGWAEAEDVALKTLFGVTGDSEEALIAALASVLSDGAIDSAVAAFASFAGSAKLDKDAEAALREAKSSQGESRAAALRSVFLKADGNARERVCTKAFCEAEPTVANALNLARDRFAAIDERLAQLRVAEASGAVLMLADAILSDYRRRKRGEAALDYDDLIAKTHDLLLRPGAGAWVLFKIDGGVDHILLDEAQDTNPVQWSIIEQLASEFFAGAGASDRVRTLFAVGDEKQSIYSFQGADPVRFAAAGMVFRRQASNAALSWHDVPLTLSFRSTEPVLQAVDAVFAKSTAAQGLTWQESSIIEHHPHRKGQAGLVELWGPHAAEPREIAQPFEPWAEATAGASSVDQLCRRIAATIKHWLQTGEELASEGRKVKAGDVLILVRRREPFITPMIRALKHERISVAGADRMRLTDQLAVQDLMALADVLLMPEDDLALAVVLKSPLFDIDDDGLFKLAYRRRGSLWTELKDKSGDHPRFAEAAARLGAWQSRADLLPPYEFFSELLGADGQLMRKRMLTRLGPEAAEAIEELLDLALSYDREAAPSLQGFLNSVRAGDVEIKRDMEQDRDEVRIMTVHGAKGLQAPIVFLPDTCMGPRAQNPRIFPLPRPGHPPDAAGHLVWPPAGHSGLAALADSKARLEQAEREEYHRLLYVAMTRARDRLYVCGWQGQRAADKGCWYELVKTGLDGLLTEVQIAEGIRVGRMTSEQMVPVTSKPASAEQLQSTPLPDWAVRPAPPERARRQVQPSRLAAHLAADAGHVDLEQPPLGPIELAQNARFLRGRLVHALLQYLPDVKPHDRMRAARSFVAARGEALDDAVKDEVVNETLAILDDERFAQLFGAESLAEVPIVANIGEGADGYVLAGQIDRLAVLEDRLLILDYKTNRPPPSSPDDVAPAYINQLAAYRFALRRMFPGKSVGAALLWTDGPKLMEIPSKKLDAAELALLRPGASLDEGGCRT